MKKNIDPIILATALALLGLGAAALAFFLPAVSDITGMTELSAKGKNVVALKTDDLAATLAVWSTPTLWNEPSTHSRLFQSDQYLFYASAYPNGDYIKKLDANTRAPSGVLLSWYDAHGLDFTDPNVDREDPDGDGFSNLTEYKNEPVGVRYKAADVDPTKATDPNDAKSHPSFLSRLRLQKYETQPFHIFFNGYQQLNGVYLFQLHLSDVASDRQPQLKKTGDPLGFGGYVLGAFQQEFKDILDPATKHLVHTDVSTLELDQPDTGQKVSVPFRREINSPESTADFVMLMPSETDKVIRISVGKTFSVPFIPNTNFLVIDAGDDGATIKDLGQGGQTYHILKLEESEWNEVPLAPAGKQP